jgi:hypothetical protein
MSARTLSCGCVTDDSGIRIVRPCDADMRSLGEYALREISRRHEEAAAAREAFIRDTAARLASVYVPVSPAYPASPAYEGGVDRELNLSISAAVRLLELLDERGLCKGWLV